MFNLNSASEDELKQIIAAVFEHKVPFVHRSGLTVLAARPGYAHCRMPLKGNENHVGSFYAGAQFTLAEIPGGILAMASFDARRYYPLIKDMQIRFLKAAKTDLTVEAHLSEADITRIKEEADAEGKASFTLNCQLMDATGTVVSESEGLYQIRAIQR